MDDSTCKSIAHTNETLALAKKEHAEHMHGMEELRTILSLRPLRVRAYPLDDPKAPVDGNTKTVHFIRHGQGFHNLMADQAAAQGKTWTQFVVSPDNPYTLPEILDAPLTHKGRLQALALKSRVREADPQLVVVSPNCRAVQTALLATSGTTAKLTVLAHEACREECGVHTCDQRRPIAQQRLDFPTVDFSLLQSDEDPLWSPDHRETKVQVGERGYEFLEWLEGRSETKIVVASHSGWLLTLFNGVLECPTSDDSATSSRSSKLLDWWQTGEMRSVRLEFVRNHQGK